ncbi:hypothetical protein BHJ80_15935 [Escherichia coli]|nr:hypothetical protein BHJ80_15935 [Escherichia coli]
MNEYHAANDTAPDHREVITLTAGISGTLWRAGGHAGGEVKGELRKATPDRGSGQMTAVSG